MYNFEQIGFIPRSIVRTLKRFIKQISLKTDLFVIYEFRISRYIAIASIQCFFFLIICPWIFQILIKFLLINVFFQYRTIAKAIPRDIFINFHQQERAFSQIQTFSQKVYFETLFESFKIDKLDHEAMAVSRDNTFASAYPPTISLSANPVFPLGLVSASSLRDKSTLYAHPNSEKSISFDRRFNFKETVLDFVGIVPPIPRDKITERCPIGCIHKFELASPRSAGDATGRQQQRDDGVFKSQLVPPNLWFGGPSIHWIGQQSRAGARDAEQILKKDFRFQIPRTGILPSPSEPEVPPEGTSGTAIAHQTRGSSGRWQQRQDGRPVSKKKTIYEIYQTYFLKCAYFYNQQSILIIINWILDLTTLLFFLFLLIFSTPQILILKTFFIESLLSLSETTKCFFLIFFLDLLVGFHSSKSWEIFLQFWIEHFGFQIHQNFIFFFISTFPVLLDTIFKYWIFRYLNKISPSTVATYQAMIE